VAAPVVLPADTVLFGAFSGAEGLTLIVLLCCARPLTLMPASTIATANENLIFYQSPARNPLLRNFELPIA